MDASASAFETVIREHGRRLHAIAYAVLQDGTEAEDVVQETFLKAYRTQLEGRRFPEPEKLPAWLAALARNAAIDRLRRSRRQSPLPDDAEETHADVRGTTPSAALETRERTAQVDGLLAALPEAHRIAVTLRFMEGMDYAAIALHMGISHGALRGLLGRAMQTLRLQAALLPSLLP
ncbi:RNA polymerase sigma-70 factor, ECF subfamily [Verrucomicrobium sp. GAS474]|uniref:RNA polymerase sigma factor n=1 Tax=Verrucomicrobium sp. GAS474 TaxID=1882831 RepID=UPI00087A8665|nr:sigma-70 family RNA polymerase sigma factor [Verrucomicrobium sp. GAS474]SDT91639.1 RNA polymerase sigma-70 factor, ECF subfamily [Verrucomicrobium sp. GAS474]